MMTTYPEISDCLTMIVSLASEIADTFASLEALTVLVVAAKAVKEAIFPFTDKLGKYAKLAFEAELQNGYEPQGPTLDQIQKGEPSVELLASGEEVDLAKLEII